MRSDLYFSTSYPNSLESGCQECNVAQIMVSGPLSELHPLVTLVCTHSCAVKEVSVTGRRIRLPLRPQASPTLVLSHPEHV